MFERPTSGERAILVQININRNASNDSDEEFRLLALAAGAQIVEFISLRCDEVKPRFLIGSGQVEQLMALASEQSIQLFIFNATLTPSQERNLERQLATRVVDRSGLVLDIFAQRARSHAGKLQVELAQLKHLATRLVRGWTHLERQKGGIGLRGPGETQLETDRRLLAARVTQLQKKLQKVANQRLEMRKFRKRREWITVALTGYTNSGKSTLFNSLTMANAIAKDQLFATLDPMWRKLHHDGNQVILLADTVGFISDLPHELVAAFHSTLEESIHADLLLHVIDYSDDNRGERERVVNEVLHDIAAADVPLLRVYNKIDLTTREAAVQKDANGVANSVFISAKTGAGIPLLTAAISDFFAEKQYRAWIKLTPQEGELRAKLYAAKAVVKEVIDDNGEMNLQISLNQKYFNKLKSQYNRPFEIVEQRPKEH